MRGLVHGKRLANILSLVVLFILSIFPRDVMAAKPFSPRDLTPMKYCAIVDGASTGKYYPFYLKKKGYRCIHIQSSPEIPSIAKKNFDSSDYEALLVFQGDLDPLLASLSEYPIEFVIPGSEPGVELANDLSYALNLYPNTQDLGKRCRDKFLMGETLRKKGIRSIQQHKIKNVAEALSAAKMYARWPLVIKPIDSGGADGFHVCRNEQELARRVASVLGTKTIFDKTNEQLLLQEYVSGPEYIVNTVSFDAHHFIESFFVYEKRDLLDEGLIFENYSLISASDSPQANEIFAYTLAVLDALGLKYGAAHSEIILTEEGPVLVECNARPHGHSLPIDLMTECLGQTQVELTTLAYTNPTAFLERIKTPFSIKKYMASIHLISNVEGKIKELHFIDDIKKLLSFHSLRLYHSPGDWIKKTVDLPTCPGDVFLKSENRDQLWNDASQIREWEAQGIFEKVVEDHVGAHR